MELKYKERIAIAPNGLLVLPFSEESRASRI